MSNLAYLGLDIIFFTPLLLLLIGYLSPHILKHFKYIIFCSFLGAVYFFTVDPFATKWGAWQFNYGRTLNIRIGLGVIEKLLWAILCFFILAVVISMVADAEEKRKNIRDYFKKY
jgi:uncharacterized membrane protein